VAIYDLYAVEAASIGEARTLIEGLLSTSLEEHESSFHRGPYYSRGQMGEENLELKLNLDPYEDEPNEDEFPDRAILLYVNKTGRSSELNEALSKSNGAVFLIRHEDI